MKKIFTLDNIGTMACVAFLVFILFTFLFAGCKNEMPLQQDSDVLKVNIRLVAIDSMTQARTEDKVLFVNIK